MAANAALMAALQLILLASDPHIAVPELVKNIMKAETLERVEEIPILATDSDVKPVLQMLSLTSFGL